MLWCVPCMFIHLFSIYSFPFSLHFPHLSHLYRCHVTHVSRFGRDCRTNDIFDATIFKSAASKTSYLGQSLPNLNSHRVMSMRRAPARSATPLLPPFLLPPDTNLFSRHVIVTLLMSLGVVQTPEHAPIDGLWTRSLVIPVHHSLSPPSPKPKNVRLIVFGRLTGLSSTLPGVIEPPEHVPVDSPVMRGLVQPVYPHPPPHPSTDPQIHT